MDERAFVDFVEIRHPFSAPCCYIVPGGLDDRLAVFAFICVIGGHPEYDKYTLDSEYRRDVDKGLPIHVPVNYYPDDDPSKPPLFRWRAHAHLLYENWLNYYVYQNTPYDLGEIQRVKHE